MNFLDLQKNVTSVLAAAPAFTANPSAVFADLGNQKSQFETALANVGYAISTWPPIRGKADPEASYGGQALVKVLFVVRVAINPSFEKVQADAFAYVNGFVEAVIAALLSAPADGPGGAKYCLHEEDPFELVQFDTGLIDYHIRFWSNTVFGGNTNV